MTFARLFQALREPIQCAFEVAEGLHFQSAHAADKRKIPDPAKDIVIIHAEFRPELPGAKPAWIIGFHNNSSKYTYDQIQVAATYLDGEGKIVDRDKLVIRQKLPPGDEKLIGSVDFKSRGTAIRGSLTVTGATITQ